MKGLFITATDTGVGKTVIIAGLSLALQNLGYKVKLMKPVQSGHALSDFQGDGQTIKRLTGTEQTIEQIVSYSFLPPVAPGLAAKWTGNTIDLKQILQSFKTTSKQADIVLIEGAGGLMTPLGEDWTIADLAKAIGLSLLIIARPHLGTINHTILTTIVARALGLSPLGIILNGLQPQDQDMSVKDNPKLITSFTQLPVWGTLPWIESELTSERLLASFVQHIDIRSLIKELSKDDE